MQEKEGTAPEQSELNNAAAVETPAGEQPVDQNQQMVDQAAALYAAARSGGGWFYWIAGLSLVNTVISLFQGDWYFLVGLGATQIVDALISEYGGSVATIGVVINLFITGFYLFFGFYACRFMKWAFIVGMIVYFLDALLTLLIQQWMGLAFHAYALYCIFRGYGALKMASEMKSQL